MIVEFEQLQRISGFTHKAKVCGYLEERGIAYETGRDGEPWTTVDAINRALLDDRATAQPHLDECRSQSQRAVGRPSPPVDGRRQQSMTAQEIRRVVAAAAEEALARRPPPSCVTLKQAAEMLGISTGTARKLNLPRNRAGLINYEDVLAVRDSR